MPQIRLFHLITSAEWCLWKEQVPVYLDLMETIVLRLDSLFSSFLTVLGAKPALKFGLPKLILGLYCPTQSKICNNPAVPHYL